MFLLDTDVISALRKWVGVSNLTVWMEAQRPSDLYISVVSVGEMERGIARQRRRNPDFARTLAAWLDSVLLVYGDRILPVDLAVARRWGMLSGALGHDNTDLFIAATALEHGLTVVTRNVRHFEPTGVPVLNPF
ncbi:MAG: type II toxin-antitoxin system VapC family toxin [Chloroflexota bacterium]|nr:type II toxin-antitoxin system VapC family toxin [Chloroflexota bacterium]MDE2885585.1 type II toxin-antitoxin system VapC family toxin [Chloroflexota bacterium]